MLLDVTRPLAARSEPWPGDAPLSWELAEALDARGGGVNLARMSCSTHAGTHVDAPWHVLPDGARVHELPLDAFVGPARVVDALAGRGLVQPSERVLRQLDGAQRVLFRTVERNEPHRFPASFAGLAPGLAEELVRRRVRLAGTDAPSVDARGAAGLPVHRILARAGCVVLEWLDLAAATPGDYELLALPLRLEGLDASPVRAVLRRPG